VSFDVGLIRWL